MQEYRPSLLGMTGVTGSLGLHFLGEVLKRDSHLKVLALARRDSVGFLRPQFQHLLSKFPGRIRVIDTDLRLPRFTDEARGMLAEVDDIWHFAACTNLSAGDTLAEREVYKVNEEGTFRLLNTLRELNFKGQFFHISTAYVAGRRTGTVKENELNLGQQFHNSYEHSKMLAEELVQSFFSEGARGLIFRPSIILENAPGIRLKIVDLCTHAIFAAIRHRDPEFVFRLPDYSALNLVQIDWVIDAMLALAGGRPGATVYHLTNQCSTRMKEIAAALHDYIPDFAVSFRPAASRQELNAASRLCDKALADARPYFTAGIEFDSRNTDRDLPRHLKDRTFNISELIRVRLIESGLLPCCSKRGRGRFAAPTQPIPLLRAE